MVEIDYNEILLQAIDTIVLQRISEVNFDKTIVCTITDDTDRANGHYVVTDGSIRFDAYAENTYYMTNDKVYIQIPLNDWSQKKTIIGRYRSDDNDTPTAYVPPLDKIINITGNLVSTRFSSGNTAANFKGYFSEGKPVEGSSELIVSRKSLDLELQGFDILGLKADFKSTLNNYLIKKGSYGLRVYLYAESINGGEEIISLDLNSSKDMFGNVYGYLEFLTQQQAYKLNTYELKKLHQIDVVLYQTGDFQYVNEQGSIAYLPVTQISEDDVLSNIFVENIEVFLGYDITAVPEDLVKIFSTSSEIYDPADVDTLEKHMNLVWYHKDKNNRYLNFTDGTFGSLEDAKDPNKQVYFIEWQHSLNDGQWETLVSDFNQTEIYITIDNLWAINEYRAIIYFAGGSYTSNIFTYKLKQGLTSSSVNASLNLALTVHNGKNALDAYPYYGADTALINPVESSVPRHIWFSYESAIGRTFEPDVLSGATIQLLIPKISSMLDKPIQKPTSEDANFYIYEKQLVDSFTQEDKTFVYRIKPHYNPLFQNNTLTLKVIDKNGYEYTTSKTINFSRNGNTGTDYTLIISDKNGRLAAFYSEKGDGNLELVAQLYDANFNLIEDAIIEFDENYYSANDALVGYPIATAFTSINWLGEQVTLQSKYPVSFSAEEGYIYQGPTTIVYDSQGLHPIYYNGALGLFDKNMNSLNPVWDLEFYDQDGKLCPLEQGEVTDYPRIKDNNTIIAPSMFLRDNPYNVVLVAYSESIEAGETLWRQPLIILSNNYSSSILNNWDGQIQVNQDGNYILSSAMAAGYKKNNAFYGIVLGDISVVDYGNITGLFGYNNGEQSFGFDIDGTGFIGKSGSGRIEFKGDKCVIQSAKYGELNASGSKWDLDDGSLILQGESSYLKFNENHSGQLEMKISGMNIILENNKNLNDSVAGQIEASTEAISATVSKKLDSTWSGTSFGWSLTDTGFYIDNSPSPSADNYVLSVDRNGLKVDGTGTFSGTITATSGKIGGWSLSPLKNSSGTIYGYSLTSGIEGTKGFIGLWTSYPTDANYRMRIGTKFSIDSDGILDASGAIISGNITATSGTFNGDIAAKTLSLANAQSASNLQPYSIGKVLDATALKAQVSYSSISSDGEVTFTATLETIPAVKCTGYMSVTYNDVDVGSTTTTLVFNFTTSSPTATVTLSNVHSIAVSANSIDITINKPGIAIQASLVPANKSKEYTLGSESLPWACVYATNNTIQLSDERLKNLSELTSREEIFFNNIHPLKYLWKQGDKQYHFGFGAQSVQESLEQSGLNVNEYFIVQQGETMNLCYSEFIALNTWQIQKLKQRVSELEAQLSIRDKGE